MTLTQLRSEMDRMFDLSELRNLCFDLGISWEAVGGMGENKPDRLLSIVTYCSRHDKLDRLVTYINQQRDARLVVPVSIPDERGNPNKDDAARLIAEAILLLQRAQQLL
jgi:hypothetical protein